MVLLGVLVFLGALRAFEGLGVLEALEPWGALEP